MPPPSKVDRLPLATRDWLNRALIARGFGGYSELAQALSDMGYEISRSAVHRHGQALERKLSAIKASTEAARLIAEAAPDDEDARSAAVISMVQTEMFDVLLALQDAEDADTDAAERVKLLARAAKSIAELSRASVNQKKWAADVQARAQAAAESVEKIAAKGGLSEQAVAAIRREILGIAS